MVKKCNLCCLNKSKDKISSPKLLSYKTNNDEFLPLNLNTKPSKNFQKIESKTKGVYNRLAQVTHPNIYLSIMYLPAKFHYGCNRFNSTSFDVNGWWLCLLICQSCNFLMTGSNSFHTNTFSKVLLTWVKSNSLKIKLYPWFKKFHLRGQREASICQVNF